MLNVQWETSTLSFKKNLRKDENDMDNSYKRLEKSSTNRMICGVCGGIGNYFNIDPTIIRLLMVIFGCTGTGIVAYFIAAIVIPNEGEGR